MRRVSFAPVGVNNTRQKADFGEVMATLGIDRRPADDFAIQISRVERELLWARDRGLTVPDYIARAFREAVERLATGPTCRTWAADGLSWDRPASDARGGVTSRGLARSLS